MKKPVVTLESLDISLEGVNVKLESLDSRMDKFDTRMDRFDSRMDQFDSRMDKFDSRMVGFDSRMDGLDLKIDRIDKKIDSNTFEIRRMFTEFVNFVNFVKEHVMLRDETKDYIDERIETKFSKYTSDQFEFQDRVGKRCENNEHENLGLHHRVARLEKHVGIV